MATDEHLRDCTPPPSYKSPDSSSAHEAIIEIPSPSPHQGDPYACPCFRPSENFPTYHYYNCRDWEGVKALHIAQHHAEKKSCSVTWGIWIEIFLVCGACVGFGLGVDVPTSIRWEEGESRPRLEEKAFRALPWYGVLGAVVIIVFVYDALWWFWSDICRTVLANWEIDEIDTGFKMAREKKEKKWRRVLWAYRVGKVVCMILTAGAGLGILRLLQFGA